MLDLPSRGRCSTLPSPNMRSNTTCGFSPSAAATSARPRNVLVGAAVALAAVARVRAGVSTVSCIDGITSDRSSLRDHLIDGSGVDVCPGGSGLFAERRRHPVSALAAVMDRECRPLMITGDRDRAPAA
jgi:hypothetical protein